MSVIAGKRSLLVFFAALILAAALPWWPEPKVDWEPATFRDVPLERRQIEANEGVSFTALRGNVSVPERRAVLTSRSISIGFAVVPGVAGADGPPVFMVAGGPGGSHIANLDRSWVQVLIQMFRRVGDVVLVDLRGIHSSTPNFELSGLARKWRTVASDADMRQLIRDQGTDGRSQLLEAGFDLSGYVVTEAAADLIAVADRLGYTRINLYGTSFGSHYTLTTVRQFPERVQRFFITGVEGYDHTYDDGVEVLRAVELIAQEAEAVWGRAHGAGNPLEALQALAEKAAKNAPEAHGLKPHEMVGLVKSGDFLDFEYQLSSREGMRSWPHDVARIVEGDRAWRMPLVRRLMGQFVGKDASDAAVGLFDCASHISEERQTRLRATAPVHFPDDVAFMESLCSGWAVAPLPATFQAGEMVETPGLLLHGTYDVATPYANALETLRQFPEAALVTVHGGSHAALWEALEAEETFSDDIVRWFRGGAAPKDVRLGPIEFLPMDD